MNKKIEDFDQDDHLVGLFSDDDVGDKIAERKLSTSSFERKELLALKRPPSPKIGEELIISSPKKMNEMKRSSKESLMKSLFDGTEQPRRLVSSALPAKSVEDIFEDFAKRKSLSRPLETKEEPNLQFQPQDTKQSFDESNENQILMWSQKQSEALMAQEGALTAINKQLQSESEIRTKNEFLRNQMKLVLGLETSLNEKQREDNEEMERIWKDKVAKIKSIHSEHVCELENRISELLNRIHEDTELHRKEIKMERDNKNRELEEQSMDFQRKLKIIKEDYEQLLSNALESRKNDGDVIKAVECLITQVSNNTNDLGALFGKVDGKVHLHDDSRDMLLKNKEKRIRELIKELEEVKTHYTEKAQNFQREIDDLRSEIYRLEKSAETRSCETERKQKELEREAELFRFKKEKHIRQLQSDNENLQSMFEEAKRQETLLKKKYEKAFTLLEAERAKFYFKTKLKSTDVDHFLQDIPENACCKDTLGLILALRETEESMKKQKLILSRSEMEVEEYRQEMEQERTLILKIVEKLSNAERDLIKGVQDIEQVLKTSQEIRTEASDLLNQASSRERNAFQVLEEVRKQMRHVEHDKPKSKRKQPLNNLGLRTAGDGQSVHTLKDIQFLTREAHFLNSISVPDLL